MNNNLKAIILFMLSVSCSMLNAISIYVDIHNESDSTIQLGYTEKGPSQTVVFYDDDGNRTGSATTPGERQWYSDVTIAPNRIYYHSEQYGGLSAWFYYPSLNIKDTQTGAIGKMVFMPVRKSGKVVDYNYRIEGDRWLAFAEHSTSFTEDAVYHSIRIY